MATYPASIWVRAPVVDGITSLDDAMALLDQGREEVEAIQTELGTSPSTNSFNTLAERLDVRLSQSGLPKGRVQPAREYNGDGDDQTPTYRPIAGWWEKKDEIEPQYILFGVTASLSGVANEVQYNEGNFVYGVRPDAVIARYCSRSDNPLIGAVTIKGISKTGFQARVQGYKAGKSIWGNTDQGYFISYIAIGGAPP